MADPTQIFVVFRVDGPYVGFFAACLVSRMIKNHRKWE